MLSVYIGGKRHVKFIRVQLSSDGKIRVNYDELPGLAARRPGRIFAIGI
jgi:hypothetical protein